MSLSGKKWIWPDQNQGQALELARTLNIPPALGRLLINRGVVDAETARAFLYPRVENLHSPWLLAGMEQAVERLLLAVQNKEKIIIHGDYDADGITATVIMVEALKKLGGDAGYYLPSRFDEGYGLHREPLKQFREEGATLVITVDCGINAVEEIAYASSIGLDLVITDHHQPLHAAAGALAVINPLQKNCTYPFKELSGAGLAFKLACALSEKSALPFPGDLLDLAALGTAADVVPLVGENRIIVATGIEVLRSRARIGFRALAEAAKLKQEMINSTTLTFVLAPAINAAGRMGEALPAAKLLLSDNEAEAGELASELQRANQLRRTTEQRILQEAEAAATAEISAGRKGIITLSGENWHHGVIGIVASRLVDKFNRPFALIALEGDEGRGSARSVAGFDITAALAASAALLERFGGHEQAAGFSIKTDNVDQLRESLEGYATDSLQERLLAPLLKVEAELCEEEINLDLVAVLERLEPFGPENPIPLFGSRRWEILSWQLVGADKKHLKLSLGKGGSYLQPIFFGGADNEKELEIGRFTDLAFKLKRSTYGNRENLEVVIKDLLFCDSYRSAGIEIIDRRGCEDRLKCLCAILGHASEDAVIFAATAARTGAIKAGLSGKACRDSGPFFISSGSLNEGLELPREAKTIILYDLPLHQRLLEPYLFKRTGAEEEEKVFYLLFNGDDLERNELLLNHTLPTETQLEEIMAALLEAVEEGAAISFPGPAETVFSHKPSAGYWERTFRILQESGFIEGSVTEPIQAANLKPQAVELSRSTVFKESVDLRKECSLFQQLLLEGSLDQIRSSLG